MGTDPDYLYTAAGSFTAIANKFTLGLFRPVSRLLGVPQIGLYCSDAYAQSSGILDKGVEAAAIAGAAYAALPSLAVAGVGLAGGGMTYASTHPEVISEATSQLSAFLEGAGTGYSSVPIGGGAAEGEGGLIYRSGSATDTNLTPRLTDNGWLSCRNSLSNPIDPTTGGPLKGNILFEAGDTYQIIDSAHLPGGTFEFDGGRNGHEPGHVSIGPDVQADVIRNAIIRNPGNANGNWKVR